MFKELINECRITFCIKNEGPILIKGKNLNEIADQDLNNSVLSDCNIQGNQNESDMMVFIRTWRNNRFEPFIPGSSLKGVMRNQSEKIARTLMPFNSTDETEQGCCNPFTTQKAADLTELSCSDRFQLRKDDEQDIKSSTIYRESCPVCKLFGNTFLQSRIMIPDGYSATHKMQKRDGVGIDRYSGGSAMTESGGAKFAFEVEENAIFKFQDIVIRNFDLWQLGLFAYIFQDFKDKLIKIGYGKSRGLGNVFGTIDKMKITYFGTRRPPENQIVGMAHFIGNSEYYSEEREINNASFSKTISIPGETNIELVSTGIRHTYMFPNQSTAEAMLNATAPAFSNNDGTGYLNGSIYEVPEVMRKSRLEALKAKSQSSQTEEENHE